MAYDLLRPQSSNMILRWGLLRCTADSLRVFNQLCISLHRECRATEGLESVERKIQLLNQVQSAFVARAIVSKTQQGKGTVAKEPKNSWSMKVVN